MLNTKYISAKNFKDACKLVLRMRLSVFFFAATMAAFGIAIPMHAIADNSLNKTTKDKVTIEAAYSPSLASIYNEQSKALGIRRNRYSFQLEQSKSIQTHRRSDEHPWLNDSLEQKAHFAEVRGWIGPKNGFVFLGGGLEHFSGWQIGSIGGPVENEDKSYRLTPTLKYRQYSESVRLKFRGGVRFKILADFFFIDLIAPTFWAHLHTLKKGPLDFGPQSATEEQRQKAKKDASQYQQNYYFEQLPLFTFGLSV